MNIKGINTIKDIIFLLCLSAFFAGLLAVVLFGFAGCGDGKVIETPPSEEDQPPFLEEVEPTPEPINPICPAEPMPFKRGMLWKPESDTTGTLVVLIAPEFRKEFQRCYVVTKKGNQEQMTFRGFSNGDRQTWRAQRHGSRYQNTFTCVDEDQLCLWQFSGDSGKRQE